MPAESLIECPPFAENVPPAQCLVIINSISEGNLSDASVDQTINYQAMIVPLPPGTDGVTSMSRETVFITSRTGLFDRAKTLCN